MKQTMNKVIKEDLKKYCLHRRTKTLLLWGINDSETPLKDGYTFYNLYEQSRMIIFYKSGAIILYAVQVWFKTAWHLPFCFKIDFCQKLSNIEKSEQFRCHLNHSLLLVAELGCVLLRNPPCSTTAR